MSKGDTRRSQSAIFFTASKKQEEDLNQQPTKRPREDHVNPLICVCLVNEPLTENSEHSMQAIHESTKSHKVRVPQKFSFALYQRSFNTKGFKTGIGTNYWQL